jgi:uncharacterized coiled-coil protein SlyX
MADDVENRLKDLEMKVTRHRLQLEQAEQRIKDQAEINLALERRVDDLETRLTGD